MAQQELILDLIRHGIAEAREVGQADHSRSLTETGQQRTRQVAARLQSWKWSWQMILCSPLLRAQQTAAILVDTGLAPQMETFAPLAPQGSFAELESWHQRQPHIHHLALVGHQPHLGQWVVQALWGETNLQASSTGEVIQLKKTGIAQVVFPGGKLQAGQGMLTALLRPKFLL
ncbi:MAG: phosphohistidine phosphatase SixA [Synechococcaceae cyanobacterium SM2_3_1]|nr:phosphohistidine phosphatase SixA [Synechococcaceae cyanobacterium SM2_3_1]